MYRHWTAKVDEITNKLESYGGKGRRRKCRAEGKLSGVELPQERIDEQMSQTDGSSCSAESGTPAASHFAVPKPN
ncbi:hypothetical protein O1611_g7045 [Lasiodiplodia mahajangana]|uniref:Uncharacterized protein n=1 Tax=Lasiodiplodia mahajangana TaxID=1108764 RepID=A0ACC2JGF4_9PEZI|nr:hypothetical protein O1611_g7045 [Lasiodiplodia mahajangana]